MTQRNSLELSLKVMFKTAHCAVAETAQLVSLRLCCLLLNKSFCLINHGSKEINVPSDQTCAMSTVQEGMGIFFSKIRN